jgi:hypothetical protein
LGVNAGLNNLGINSVAIGTNAQPTGANTIVLNSSGITLAPSTANAFFVNPVRVDTTNTGNIAFYNPTSKEVTYSSTVSTAGNVTAGNLISTGNLFFGSTRFTPKVQVLTRASGNVAVTVSLS